MANFLKDTLFLRAFGLVKIPLIFFIKPSIIDLTDKRTIVKVPLSYRTKNHLGSMYFGVLCTGADCAGGLLAMRLVQSYGKRASMVFKDFKAEFLKRPDSDVLFICEDGEAAKTLVEKAAQSAERENTTVNVRAECKGEIVAKFELTLSVKVKRASA